MDRSLDEIIAERPSSTRGQVRNRPRRSNAPRDGAKKVRSPPPSPLASSSRIVKAGRLPACASSSQAIGDWVHDDKFEENRNTAPSYRGSRARRLDWHSPQPEPPPTGAKLRVTNLHYDLSEDDLEDLFTRVGPINALSLRYDRAGRSEGVAFVTYKRLVDAQTAIREFDGANAKGQPITLTLMSSNTSGKPARRNPFDFAEKPKGSLFDRTEKPRTRDSRSLSPDASENVDDTSGRVGGRTRRSDVSKPAPEHIDRYVPGQRSPWRRGDGGRGRGRRPGEAREVQERNGSAAGSGRRAGNRRPKKTQEELDQEMEDYWGTTAAANGNGNGAAAPAATSFSAAPASTEQHDDIDMIE
ncbi:THO complex subunit 4 [Blastomyces parvus]|uniref:THO complex subunit 4 n=1 Tax=Blastomyces parvus TaxID=2060905 RepID=A0A2B7XLH3_9EURO|nr:THO complex subunit 4 [Blastomyces parvus]